MLNYKEMLGADALVNLPQFMATTGAAGLTTARRAPDLIKLASPSTGVDRNQRTRDLARSLCKRP